MQPSSQIQRKNYTKGDDAANMQSAIQDVLLPNRTKTIAEIAETYRVDRNALSRRASGQIALNSCQGKKPFLSPEEEDKLATFLVEMAELGFGFSLDRVRYLVRTQLNKNPDDITHGWHAYFMKKHPELTIRRTEALDRLRSRSLSQETVDQYFKILNLAFAKCKDMSNNVDLNANRVFVMDETGLSPNQKQGYVVAKKGSRSVFAITSENREHLTILGGASASGWACKPMFILPKAIPNFLGRQFEGSKVEVTSSGYITDAAFASWANFFIEEIKEVRGDPSLWSLLIVDGHTSHTYNPVALDILNAANILVVCLPSHSTSLLQVHDVGIFGPFKRYLATSIAEYIQLCDPNIQLKNLPPLLQDPWDKANANYNIRSAFKAVGLWPLNLNWGRENDQKLKLLMIQKKDEQFLRLRQRAEVDTSFPSLVASLEYLDVAIRPQILIKKIPDNKLRRGLSLILDHAFSYHSNSQKLQQANARTNYLGERFCEAKILNGVDRIQQLKEYKEEQERQKEQQLKRKEDQLRRKEEQARKKEQQLKKKEDQLKRKEEQERKKEDRLRRKEEQEMKRQEKQQEGNKPERGRKKRKECTPTLPRNPGMIEDESTIDYEEVHKRGQKKIKFTEEDEEEHVG